MNTHTESAEMVTQPLSTHKLFQNLTGQRFADWTVISYAGRYKWNCICECGKSKAVLSDSLKSGKSTSCGCNRVKANAARATHGMTNTIEYSAWATMKDRCLNPSNRKYPRYGGRGITICARWLHSFDNFFCDMGFKPSKAHSIDRIDNDGNYSPENCHWGTAREQSRNRSSNRILTFGGESMCVAAWAERINVDDATLYARLSLGWTDEEIIAGKRSNH